MVSAEGGEAISSARKNRARMDNAYLKSMFASSNINGYYNITNMRLLQN
jgi:hypothetical protein